jgi:hypothetical protein
MKFPLHRTPAQGHPAKYCFAGTTMAGDSLHCSPAKAGVPLHCSPAKAGVPLHCSPAQGHPAKYYFAGTPKAGVQFLVFLLLGPGSRAGARKGEL